MSAHPETSQEVTADLRLIHGPLPQPDANSADRSTGAVASFEGRVRDAEQGVTIAGLVYEAYEDMALHMLRKLVLEVNADHPCRKVWIAHRLGFVPIGEAAIRIEVHSKHRAEGFAFLARFMDRLKQDVPIWKVDAIPEKSDAKR